MENQTDVDTVFKDMPAAGFSDRPVPRSAIEQILDVARRAPSGVNTQPWNVFVLQGQARSALLQAGAGAVPGLLGDAACQTGFWRQFNLQPGTGGWSWAGEEPAQQAPLSRAIGAPVAARAQAQAELLRYFRFFDAPVGLMFTIHRSLDLGSVLDYGMFLQNITLAARARGLHSCLQTGWRGLADKVLPILGAGEDMLVLGGMALGYADSSQAPVQGPSRRPPAGSFTTWHA